MYKLILWRIGTSSWMVPFNVQFVIQPPLWLEKKRKSLGPCYHSFLLVQSPRPTYQGVSCSVRAAGTVQTRDHVTIKRQLQEQAGFLVSRGLTLPTAPPFAGDVIWWFSQPLNKVCTVLPSYWIVEIRYAGSHFMSPHPVRLETEPLWLACWSSG